MALTFCSIEDRRALFFHPSFSSFLFSLFLLLPLPFRFSFPSNCQTRLGIRGDQFPPRPHGVTGVTDGGPPRCCSVPDVSDAVGQKVSVLRGRDNGKTIQQQYCFEVLRRSRLLRFNLSQTVFGERREVTMAHARNAIIFPRQLPISPQSYFSWKDHAISRD